MTNPQTPSTPGADTPGWHDGTRPPFGPGPMDAFKAAYFMRRFKHEEKLLGPNEQKAIEFVLAMLEAPQSSTAAMGWRLVPVEPTKVMLDAVVTSMDEAFHGLDAEKQYREDWDAMLAAAPLPPAPQGDGHE
jgi:hypothetical protein